MNVDEARRMHLDGTLVAHCDRVLAERQVPERLARLVVDLLADHPDLTTDEATWRWDR